MAREDTQRVHVEGLDEVLKDLERFRERIDALPTVAATIIRNQTIRRFQVTKRDPENRPWTPLSERTLAMRKTGKLSKGSGILVNTGRLMNSVMARAEGPRAVVSTNVFYGRYHHDGTRRMPRRRFLGLSAEDTTELAQRLEAFLFAPEPT